MCRMRFALFGKLRTQIDEREVSCLEGRKLQELLCYLLLFRGRPHAREALAGLLWPDATTAHARKNLRQTLWQLQSLLDGEQTGPPMALVVADVEWIRMDTPAGVWLDVAEFEAAFDAVHATPAYGMTREQARQLAAAVDLYKGDLLEGWYQDWCVYERERFQIMVLAMLDRLVSDCEVHRDYETGILYALRALRVDRAHERAHRRLMRLYARLGDRTSALRQYQACVAALAEELDVKPAARTEALYQQIYADCFMPEEAAVPSADPPLEANLVALQKTADYLRQLQASLNRLHVQLDQCMHMVEQTMLKARLASSGD